MTGTMYQTRSVGHGKVLWDVVRCCLGGTRSVGHDKVLPASHISGMW